MDRGAAGSPVQINGAPRNDFKPLPPDDPQACIQAERPYLLRYAALQLRDRDAADDANFDSLFDKRGPKVDPPQAWENPKGALEACF